MRFQDAADQKQKQIAAPRYAPGKTQARLQIPKTRIEVPLDYNRCRRYAGGQSDLERHDLRSIDDLVKTINARRVASGRRGIPQGDFPSTKRTFERLIAELDRQT